MKNNKMIFVFLFQIFSIIGFGFLYSSLTLFLISHNGLSNVNAYYLTTKFLYFNFAISIMVGVLGKKVISFNIIILFCVISQILGFLILFKNIQVALFFIVIGTGCIIPIVTFFTNKYSDEKSLIKNNILNYGFMNVGFIFIFFISAILEYQTVQIIIECSLICSLIIALILNLGYQETLNTSFKIKKINVITLLILIYPVNLGHF
jgi:MFS family permease